MPIERLEAKVAVLEERVNSTKDDIHEIKTMLKEHVEHETDQIQLLHEAVLKAQTGWKVLAWLGGAGATIVGLTISLWKATTHG